MVMGIGAQLHSGNLGSGLTDAVSFQGSSLLIPLTDSGGVGKLLHVVVIAQLQLGLEGLGNGDNAISINGGLGLNNIEGDGNDLTILIEGSFADCNISLGLGGILVLGIFALFHGSNHAQTGLVGGSGRRGIRGRSGLFAAGYQRKSHHRNQKDRNKLFHFLFLLEKYVSFWFFCSIPVYYTVLQVIPQDAYKFFVKMLCFLIR